MKEKGFTLIEMLVVLFIISILILITIPNVTRHFETVDAKGCEAYLRMVQGQVEAYKIEFNKIPTMEDLMTENYIKEDEGSCPNGAGVMIKDNGEVILKGDSLD